jgi:predicted TIM-barrel fold metal-dependent hydrolase
MSKAIDLFCHWLPPRYVARLHAYGRRPLHMLTRAMAMPVMVDLEARFRVMDLFPGYTQVPSLASPPLEHIGDVAAAIELARIGNDEQAEIVAKYPDRFQGFVAALPMCDPESAQAEATRAIRELGAVGVQIFSNINGCPLDESRFLDVLRHVDALDRPVWLHPTRGMDHADYRSERLSKFDLWWAFGWPYETSMAMGRIVFSAILEQCPKLRIITHHAGGMVPMLEGRIASGLSLLGTRCPPGMEAAVETSLQQPPVEMFKRFFADTATFGSRAAIECALGFFGVDRLVFASDMPFDPQQGAGYIRSTLRAIAELEVTEGERERILSGNARQLCRMSVPPGTLTSR